MTKTEFLLNLQNGRRQWHQVWRGIDLFGTSSPRKPGEMSLRDTLFHVAWYEREMVNMCKLRTLAGSAWWDLPVDERNALIKTEGQTISLLQAWRVEEQAFTDLLAQLQTLTDEELEDPHCFKDMPVDWKPWLVIASNTYEHYLEHFSSIY
ncbi:MAG: hypothetical protein C3F13_04215 [Anaerolineales bacterium]|nr:hypothetical protein [Anaerolineae bacterium]PWB55491.1 MAG: hypothetical protein C3F13_04215 [Anaerolineales bacterium]